MVTTYDASMKNVDNVEEVVNNLSKEIENIIDSIKDLLKEQVENGKISQEKMNEILVKVESENQKIKEAEKIIEDLEKSAENSEIAKNSKENAEKTIENSTETLKNIENNILAEEKNEFQFIVSDKTFENKTTLATMFTNKDLIIKVLNKTINNDFSNFKFNLNYSDLKNLKEIKIESEKPINDEKLEPILIDFNLENSGQKVGQIEYYSATKIKKKADIIYVKLKDEKNYPSYFTTSGLQKYLNESSMNQLFMQFELNEIKFDSQLSSEDLKKVSKENILYKLNKEKFNLKEKEIPQGYDTTKDYYYVLNIVREKDNNSNDEQIFLGGAHWTSENGGFHVKTPSSSGESVEEMAAHEFGHWVNFPHTFDLNMKYNIIKIHETQGQSKDNFMDYNIQRKSWYKIQLLNSNREEKK